MIRLKHFRVFNTNPLPPAFVPCSLGVGWPASSAETPYIENNPAPDSRRSSLRAGISPALSCSVSPLCPPASCFLFVLRCFFPLGSAVWCGRREDLILLGSSVLPISIVACHGLPKLACSIYFYLIVQTSVSSSPLFFFFASRSFSRCPAPASLAPRSGGPVPSAASLFRRLLLCPPPVSAFLSSVPPLRPPSRLLSCFLPAPLVFFALCAAPYSFSLSLFPRLSLLLSLPRPPPLRQNTVAIFASFILVSIIYN